MSPPKFTHYELKLEGDPDVIAFLKTRLPASHATIAEANAARRAVKEPFGDAVRAEIIRAWHILAKMVRRKLRLK